MCIGCRGSSISKVIGENTRASDLFEKDVRMWVFEEVLDGRKLSEIINQDHENIKYLPGIKLPDNVVCYIGRKRKRTGKSLNSDTRLPGLDCCSGFGRICQGCRYTHLCSSSSSNFVIVMFRERERKRERERERERQRQRQRE